MFCEAPVSTVSDLSGSNNEESYHAHLQHHKLAAPLRLRSFRLPHGRCGSVDAVPYSTDDARDNHLSRAECGSLQDTTHSHSRSSNQNRLLTPKPFTDRKGHNGAEETADIIDRRDDREKVGLRRSVETEGV